MTIVAIPTNSETWLVCGGRDFADHSMFESAMSDLMSLYGCPTQVVHGGAKGADMMADAWGKRMAATVFKVLPDWDKYGKAAGPLRNQEMLNHYAPHKVIAFPGGRGTADMIARARKTRADVIEITPL